MLSGGDEHGLRSVDEVRGIELKDVSSCIFKGVTCQVNVAVSGVEDFNPLATRP